MPPTINTYGLQRLVSNLAPDELEQWEDDDGLGIPPNMRDASDDAEGVGELSTPDDYGNAPLGRPATSYDRYRTALEKRSANEMTRPQVGDYKPKGWQRALAAVANFGAGYVNAGGRVKVDPASMQSINQSLLRPGYRDAVERWKDRSHQSDVELDSAGREMQMDNAQRRAEIDAQRAKAYEEAQRKTGALADRRLQKLDEDEWKISPTGRYMYNPRTGEKKEVEAPKSPGPVKETPAEARARRAGEVKDRSDLTDEQKLQYEFNAKLPVPAKPKAGKGGGSSGKARIGTPGQFRGVEKEKQIALQKAESAYKKIANDTSISQEDKATALAALEEEKTRIMAAYDAGVETLGGSVIPRGGKPKASGKNNDPLGIR